jgi:DnaJ-class molecular chaperone
MAKVSPIRRCRTCKGQGTVTKTETVTIDGVRQTVSRTDPCPAGCNNGVLDIRTT